MSSSKSPAYFALLVICAAAFVWITSAQLPPLVASHFSASGAPNDYMSHGLYVSFMLGFIVGLPVFMVVISWFAIASPYARINLPNKDYWLAPERRDSTVDYLRSGLTVFGSLLVIFLCYVHWLVVLANAVQPARLDNAWLIGGLVVLFASVILWLKRFLGRFRHRG